MVKLISECSLSEWVEQANKIQSFRGSEKINLNQNIFSSMQFIDDEVSLYKNHKSWKIKLSLNGNPQDVAWASAYYVSTSVVRLRGLYVDPAYRNKGLMSELVTKIIGEYSGRSNKIISFSLEKSIAFHLKNGFLIDRRFESRPVEIYDFKSQSYVCDPEERITLVYRSL